MKAGLLSIAALSAVAVAQPQHGAHRHRHAKKDQVVEYATVTQVTYETAPAEMVYVDQNGNKVDQPQAQATEAPVAPVSYDNKAQENKDQGPPPSYEAPKYDDKPQENQAPPAPSSYEAPSAPVSYPAPSSSKAEQSAAPSSSSAPSYGDDTKDEAESSGLGITYSPYNSDQSCKTQDQIAKDLATLDGYSMIRMYGVDCDQTGPIIKAAKSKNWKVFAGLFEINGVEDQIAKLQKSVESEADWSIIDTISVGNEGVNNGKYTVGEVKAAVQATKACLPSEYTGSVVTVDTFTAIIANPELCSVGDYPAANCHAFFDGGKSAEESGQFVWDQQKRVADACNVSREKVWITEAGWPSQGSTNGKAVPSSENQKTAVKQLKEKFSSNMILFTAFNDYWKANTPETFGVEQYWGIYGDCPSEQ